MLFITKGCLAKFPPPAVPILNSTLFFDKKLFTLEKRIGAEQIFNYRNKMEFTFSPHRWVLEHEAEGVDRSFALGLHMTGRYDKILNINKCHIQPEIGDRILSIARDVCLKNTQLRPYDPKTHIGFLRFLMIRYGFNTSDLMVNIVTSYSDMKKLSPLTDRLLEEVPEITSMVNNVNTRKADVAFGEYETLLYGNPYIHEKLGDLTFEISANSRARLSAFAFASCSFIKV